MLVRTSELNVALAVASFHAALCQSISDIRDAYLLNGGARRVAEDPERQARVRRRPKAFAIAPESRPIHRVRQLLHFIACSLLCEFRALPVEIALGAEHRGQQRACGQWRRVASIPTWRGLRATKHWRGAGHGMLENGLKCERQCASHEYLWLLTCQKGRDI
eukprot:945779-Pleurochrysis_carterae.AAC.1